MSLISPYSINVLYAVGELKDEIHVSSNQFTDIYIAAVRNKEDNLVYKAHLALGNQVDIGNHLSRLRRKFPWERA